LSSPVFPYGEVIVIDHFTKSPIAGEREHWEVRGDYNGEPVTFWIKKDRISMLAAAGYKLDAWHNATIGTEYQIWQTISVITHKGAAGYPKLESVEDTTTGKWLVKARQEDVKKGDTLIFKGEGHPREIVSGILPKTRAGWRYMEFESGRHFNFPPATELYVLR
jgi:hypothetical protein